MLAFIESFVHFIYIRKRLSWFSLSNFIFCFLVIEPWCLATSEKSKKQRAFLLSNSLKALVFSKRKAHWCVRHFFCIKCGFFVSVTFPHSSQLDLHDKLAVEPRWLCLGFEDISRVDNLRALIPSLITLELLSPKALVKGSFPPMSWSLTFI